MPAQPAATPAHRPHRPSAHLRRPPGRVQRQQTQTWAAILLLCVAVMTGRDGRSDSQDQRDTRFFRLDKRQHVLGPSSHLPPLMVLQLLSVTMDQPQYWPDEKVRLRLVAPGRPGQKLAVQWAKRDATPVKLTVQLNDSGLAVAELADGKLDRLQLGEYRVEVKSDDGKLQGASTFAVVEGTLGEVSLAFPFERVTSTDQLDRVKAGWFMGNASGAGQRWGNGLSFKNQLRVDNEPYDGEVQLVPRCMLSGCNGIVAGPQQRVMVKGGELAATLQVGGHSGPFQVEIVTPHGSLRHQFEGSGHVERELIPVAKGVRWNHRISLAPYQGLAQLPGRALWAEKPAQPQEKDAFEIESLQAKGGQAKVTARQPLQQVAALVWTPKPDGSFSAVQVPVPSHLAAGQELLLPVQGPMVLVSLGGVAAAGPQKGQWLEGYAMMFGPLSVQGRLQLAETARPDDAVAVTVELRDAQGNPLAGSAILEAYDARVAAKDPAGPLASAVGDSLRRAGRHLQEWVDPVELERQRKEEERLRLQEEKQRKLEERREREEERKQQLRDAREERQMRQAMKKDGGMRLYGLGAGGGSGGVGYGSGRASVSAAPRMAVGGSAGKATAHRHSGDDGGEDEGEKIREGEVKVTYVAVVQTDSSGKAVVQVPTPPQVGRLALRLTAVRGLDWHTAEAQTDLRRQASVEAQVPKTLLVGGELELRAVTQNNTAQALQLRVQGAGFAQVQVREVGSGKQTHLLAWPAQAGELQLALVDAAGKTVDKRLYRIADLAKQKVTWSRLEMGGPRGVAVRQGERLVAYAGPGPLLSGMVAQTVTTMESWFPHAEALSAQIAVRALLLAAIRQGLLGDDGYRAQLTSGLEHALNQLVALYDPATQLIRPYAGMAGQPRWSAWVVANLHIARRGWKLVPPARQQVQGLAQRLDKLTADLEKGLTQTGFEPGSPLKSLASADAAEDGQELIAVEIDGQVRHLQLTDDAVQRFVLGQLAPALEGVDGADGLALSKALDRFRFLRAFERVGRLQWLTGQAKAAWLAGDKGRDAFDQLFAIVARGMILAQEPGMLQGPALLGGVYSQPMALPRFVELLLTMGLRAPEKGQAVLQTSAGPVPVPLGAVLQAPAAGRLLLPRGGVVRLDTPGLVDLGKMPEKPFAKAVLSSASLAMGQEAVLELQLDPGLDPLEYYALIAVPATVGIKQTEDALSDYKGQLLYGQQAMGSGKMQVIAVPFRGSRSVRLWIEGMLPGQAAGRAVVRHVHDVDRACAVVIPAIQVKSR